MLWHFGRSRLALGDRINIKMPSYKYDDHNYKDYTNPLHLDGEEWYLRRMRDEAAPSLESFDPHESQVSIRGNQGIVYLLSRSPERRT